MRRSVQRMGGKGGFGSDSLNSLMKCSLPFGSPPVIGRIGRHGALSLWYCFWRLLRTNGFGEEGTGFASLGCMCQKRQSEHTYLPRHEWCSHYPLFYISREKVGSPQSGVLLAYSRFLLVWRLGGAPEWDSFRVLLFLYDLMLAG